MRSVFYSIVFFSLLITSPTPGYATIFNVDVNGGGDFDSISEAILAAANGDTILVWPGSYPEDLTVNKSLLIQSTGGRGVTNINGPSTSADVLDILVDGVILEGFTISNGRYGLDISGSVTDFVTSDCEIRNTGQFHLYSPPQLIDTLVSSLVLTPHASGQFNAVMIKTGTIDRSMTWPLLPAGMVYYLYSSQNVTISGDEMPILTLLPGTTIKGVQYSDIFVRTNGALVADSVTFTSYRDDSVEGDTNGNGATVGVSADWGGISFYADCQANACSLTDCKFLFGGDADVNAVALSGVSFPITDCLFEDNYVAGLSIADASVPVTGCTFRNNRYSLFMTGTSTAEQITGNWILGQNDNAGSYVLYAAADCIGDLVEHNTLRPRSDGRYGRISVVQSTLTQSATWPVQPDSMVYHLPTGVEMTISGPDSPVLTLQPGTTIKGVQNSDIFVRTNGALVADSVTFTSYRDDSVEGDSDGNGATVGANADWGGISFYSDCQANACSLTDCKFLFGGDADVNAVALTGVSFPITDCLFEDNYVAGLSIADASVPVTGCTFRDNRYSLYMTGTSTAEQITGNWILGQNDNAGSYVLYAAADCIGDLVGQNTLRPRSDGRFGRISVVQSTLTQSATWPVQPDSMVYHLPTGVEMTISGPDSPVLTLQPGTTIKGVQNSDIFVRTNGALVADSVTFTSYRDDSVEGDSNGNGASVGANADWGGLSFYADCQANACSLTDCKFLFGGDADVAAVALTGVSFPITGCLFEYNDVAGLSIANASVPVTGCTFRNNRYSLYMSGTSTAEQIIGNYILGQNDNANSYVLYAVADCIGDLVGQNTLRPRSDGRFGRISVVQSTLTQSATWPVQPDSMVYHLPGAVEMTISGPAFPVLTLQPGTTIKGLQNSDIFVRTNGALVADSVTFTSYRDDSVEGDSNGNGASVGANADWGGLSFYADCQANACSLTDCKFLFGGDADVAAVALTGVSFPITGCLFEDNLVAGLSIANASVPVTGCTFRDNRYSLYMTGTSTAEQITGNWILGQNDNAGSYVLYAAADCIGDLVEQNTLRPRSDGRFGRISVVQSTLTQSATWPVQPDSMVYHLPGAVEMTISGPAFPVLTLQPGTTIKGVQLSDIYVRTNGALVADSVTFTSYRDDSVEGDSNGNGATVGANADWGGLSFYADCQANACSLTDCKFLFGGDADVAAVALTGVSFPITGCLFEDNLVAGLSIADASVPVTGCTFRNNRYSLYMTGTSTAEQIIGNNILGQNDNAGSYVLYAAADCIGDLVEHNTLRPRSDGRFGRISVVQSTLTQSATWPVQPDSMVYYLPVQDLTVSGEDSPMLTLQTGTFFKLYGGADIRIQSGGSLSASGVVFTSYRDDLINGDSNGDGDSPPVAGNWQKIEIGIGGSADISNCQFRYGGSGGLGALYCKDGLDTRVEFSSFANNKTGLYAASNVRPHIVACCFSGNSDYGVYAVAPTDFRGSLPARDCWWGNASGPSGFGPGTGDAVSDNILFERWTAYPRCEDFPVPVPLVQMPTRFAVHPAYPNPFNPSATIAFDLPHASRVNLIIHDISGRRVRTLLRGNLFEPGYHQAIWNGRDDHGRMAAAGVYFYTMEMGSERVTNRMVLVK